MDATPKGPPVPPTPDILSPLSSRGISDLNVTTPFTVLHRRRRHRCRRISRHPSLDARRKTETAAHASSSSFTCLCFPRLFRRKLKQLPILYLHRATNGQPVRTRKLTAAVAAGTPATLTSARVARSSCSSARTAVRRIIRRTRGDSSVLKRSLIPSAEGGTSFFTPVFTPRPPGRTFDAFSTTSVASEVRGSRRAVEEVLSIGVFAYPAKHIYELRPETPNSQPQLHRTAREQCRGALPRVLWKVSDFI